MSIIKTVYLAGGFHSGWQDKVCRELAGLPVGVIDPRNNPSGDIAVFGPLDKEHITRCDILLAYQESDNPCYAGIVAEAVLAGTLGKKVIWVDEWSDEDYASRKMKRYYMALPKYLAGAVVFYTLDAAVQAIKEILE
jgi:hypothetical protein